MADDRDQTREDAARLSLTGVPETMLWPLWNRAAETGRRDRLIEDPMAAGLVARITYDSPAVSAGPASSIRSAPACPMI